MPKRKPDRSTSSASEQADISILSPLSPPVSPLPLSTALRRAIRRSGLSLSKLAERAGVDKGSLSRFMNEKGGMSIGAAERICGVICWPIEAPRYVIFEVSSFRGQLCEVRWGEHGDWWEVVGRSEPLPWRDLREKILRCL